MKKFAIMILGAGLVAIGLANNLTAGYVDEVLSDNPVAYWRLGEADIDQDLIDLTGTIPPGTYEGGLGLETGFEGAIVGDPDTAVQFSTTVGFGCGDCGIGTVDVHEALDLGTYENATITLEAWFQILPSVNDSLPGSHFNRIFHYNNGEAGQYAFGIIGDNSAGFPGQRTVFAGVGSGLEDNGGDQGIILAAEADSIPESDDPEWHHFVALIAQEDVRLFLNGSDLGELEDSDPIFWQATQGTIGGRVQSNGSFVHPFPGLIDELAIYNTLLTEERIKAHYDAGLGIFEEVDIDELSAEVRAGTNNSRFDLNDDGLVNQEDRRVWVEELNNTYFGDSNLDGVFNSSDFVVVFQAAEYEDGVAGNSLWGTGDWNGDAEFDSTDFVFVFQDGGYEKPPRAAVNAVPEPSSLLSVLIGLVLLSGCRTKSRG